MGSNDLMSYDAVIAYLSEKKRVPNLLLGNGFGMAYSPSIFSYNALYNFVEQLEDPLLSKLFKAIKTKNFELIMSQLETFSALLKEFDEDSEILEPLSIAKEKLKTSLIDAVKSLHPEHVFSITQEECERCAAFLEVYLNNDGQVFSTNYDILLYWVLMRCKVNNCIDGFGRDREDDEDDGYNSEPCYSELRWGKYKEVQNIHYLHGALPLFDTGIEVVKEEYTGQGYLLENINRRIERGHYPIFVTAGNGDEKLEHITHNQYLSYCYQALQGISGSLVTFGFAFGKYDNHIIKAINKAAKRPGKKKLWSIYIGVFSKDDEKYINFIKGSFDCKVKLFDAKTAKIWR